MSERAGNMTSRAEREDEARDDGGDFCVSLQQIEVMQIFPGDGSVLEAENDENSLERSQKFYFGGFELARRGRCMSHLLFLHSWL